MWLQGGNTASFTETSGRRFSPSSPNGHVASALFEMSTDKHGVDELGHKESLQTVPTSDIDLVPSHACTFGLKSTF